MMISNLTDIKVQGGVFVTPISLSLFKGGNTAENLCLIYGKNGSGKSSIARAIGNIRIQADERNYEVDLVGVNLDESKQFIHVFNESFIHKRVKFLQGKKLDALVLLGEQADLDEKIQLKKERLDSILQKNVPQRLNAKKALSNKLIEKENAIEKILKRKGNHFLSQGWAEREREIKGVRQNPSVKLSNWLIDKRYTKDREELEQSLLSKTELYELTKGSAKIIAEIPEIRDVDFLNIENLLKLQIEQPRLSEREKSMFNLLKSSPFLKDINSFFGNEELETCPFCYQQVEQDYKQKFLEDLNKIFQTSAGDQHKRVFQVIRSRGLQYVNDFDIAFKQLSPQVYSEAAGIIKNYQRVTNNILEDIEKKNNNPFQPIDNNYGHLGMDTTLDNLKEKLELLGHLRDDFNNSVEQSEELRESLINLNTELAFYEIKDDLDEYRDYQYQLNISTEKHARTVFFQKKLEREIAQLEANKKNTNIAIGLINKYLAYIFFSENRLQIEASEDGSYAILVRGERINLNWLSEGEKNAIALTYFFSTLLEGKSQDEYFKDSCLIILDDPISSFDYSNKIGVFSFFRQMLSEIFLGNNGTKVVVLTHQLETMFHFEKVHLDIQRSLKHVAGAENSKYRASKKHLHREIVEDFQSNSHNEYGDNIKSIFAFASGRDNSFEDVIGNKLRKILEAFATFNYRLGTEELFYHQEILDLIDPSRQTVYQNLMARLLLHNGSHYQEAVQAYPETDLYSFLDNEEKIKTAKLVLYFLLMINRLHIKRHLTNGDADLAIIERWSSELFLGEEI